MPQTHTYRMRIAFSDCDPAQIVFFANYFKWFDTASREFFTHCGIPSWRETEATRGIVGTPLVDAQASFKQSATYGEDIAIKSGIVEWRTKAFVMHHEAWREDTLLCTGQEIRVFAIKHPDNPLRIKAIDIPADIKAACS